MRLEGGAVIEEVEVPGFGPVLVRYSRAPHGWTANFALRVRSDVDMVHRVAAPSLGQLRRAVPAAVAELLGAQPVPR